ncbi:hypothetical protein ACWDE9_20975, partial [Streptomyces olivaceoviridis]
LNHPAIVAVYDTGEDYIDGVSIPYIVMEYVDGGTGGPNGWGLARRGNPGCPFPARPGLDGTGAARDA